jgi:phosphoribosylformimino-5-aminoimidazole carboxamide ribotide isomerase
MFEEFEIVPAIDVQEGEVVQLVGGERGTETTYGDPADAARRWVASGGETLHVVDLDGAFEGQRKNAEAIRAIRSAVDVPIQVGGGIRTAKQARRLLDDGVDRVVLGTAAVENPELVDHLSETHPGRVIVGLDAAAGEVVIEGWTEGTGLDPVVAARRYAGLGAAGILFTNVDVEGSQEGVQAEPVRRMADGIDIPVMASGGVGSIQDLLSLRKAGAAAAVVGTALYEGTFTLETAKSALETGAV